MNRAAFLISLIAAVALTACQTPYKGGAIERAVATNVYEVSFRGNGYTSGDMVWNYWIYRCAELTLEKGYTSFVINKDDPTIKKSSLDVKTRLVVNPLHKQLRFFSLPFLERLHG